jgi:hypothetical protein
MVVENLAAVLHKELGLTLGFCIECLQSRDHSGFVGVKKICKFIAEYRI